MPINKKWPIAEVLKACADYPVANNARRITFEYIMLDGINDTPAEARELARLMKHYGIPAKFNLIPFNPWPGSDYRPSPPHVCKAFSDILNDAGYSAPIRVPRGRDILAACGQLKSDSERERMSRLKARVAAGAEDRHHAATAS
jgi:23S rRNA (adenine2503-C2)-methyltransferase